MQKGNVTFFVLCVCERERERRFVADLSNVCSKYIVLTLLLCANLKIVGSETGSVRGVSKPLRAVQPVLA